jgi:hypothetical protein
MQERGTREGTDMMKKIAAAAAFATATLAFAAVAQAEDFPATPMNSGPMVVRGMGPVGDVANVALTPVNVVAQPVFAGPGAPVVAADAAAPMHRRHHRHHMMMHHSMKKKHM